MPADRNGQTATFEDVDGALRELHNLGSDIDQLDIFGPTLDPERKLTPLVKDFLERDCGGVQQGWQRNVVHPLAVRNIPIGPMSVAQHNVLTGWATRCAAENGITGRYVDRSATLVLAAAVHDYHPPIWKHAFEELIAYVTGKSAKNTRDEALRDSPEFAEICGLAGAGLEDVIGAITTAEAVDHLAQEVSEYPPLSQFVIPPEYLLGDKSVFHQITLNDGKINFSGDVPIISFTDSPRHQRISLQDLPNRLRHARRLHVKPEGTGAYGGLGIMIQSILRDAYMRALGVEWGRLSQIDRDSLGKKIDADLLEKSRDAALPVIFDDYRSANPELKKDAVFETAWKFLHYAPLCGNAQHIEDRTGKHAWPALRLLCSLYTESLPNEWHGLIKKPAKKMKLLSELHAAFENTRYATHGLVIEVRNQNNDFEGTMFEGKHTPFRCGSVVVYRPEPTSEIRHESKGINWAQIAEGTRLHILNVLSENGIYCSTWEAGPAIYFAQPPQQGGGPQTKGSADGLTVAGRLRLRHIDPRFKNPGHQD